VIRETNTGRERLLHNSTEKQQRAILAGIAGNVMEWYDFTVYGYFAAVIGRQFFPAEDPVSSLLAAFGVFAAGFLMRPFGSLVFGHIGDKMGRKVALTASVILMAVPTFLIGLLPTYRQIGVTAAALLVLLRLVQGLSVGGEYTTSAIFLVEGSGPGRRGFLGSFGPFGACGGVLLGSAVGAAVTTVLDSASVDSWGWRLPFILGISVGLCGLYIRRQMIEDTGPRTRTPPVTSPVLEAFRTEWRTIVRLIGLNAAYAVGFYLCFVYITTYLRQTDHVSASKALDINTIAIAVLLLLIPLAGVLSDRLGRKPVMLAATGGLFVLAWPLFWMMHHPDTSVILLGQLSFAALVAGFAGVSPAAMVELVPDRLRCTILSVGYNLGFGILGGLTPMVAVYTITRSHDDLSPAFLLMAAGAVSFVVIAGLRETYKLALATPASADIAAVASDAA
jgi:MHS family proline/betaine transporter-like MFS transporter